MDGISLTSDLQNWIPIRLYFSDAQPFLDWCYAGNERFTDPFLGQTIDRFLQRPSNLLFRHQTPIEVLSKLKLTRPGVEPSGFIFHMSRCGSTLVTQMLAALKRCVVLAEAAPIDDVIRSNRYGITDETRMGWLQAMISALGQPRMGEQYLVIKFDAWHAADIPLISRSFPNVPVIFMYRHPIEVLVSQMNQRAFHLIPGVIDPSVFGLDQNWFEKVSPEEYCARVLASICESGLRASETGARMVNYSELPNAVTTSLLDLFSIDCDEDELAAMTKATLKDAKNPVLPFDRDSEKKQQKGTRAMHEAVEKWLLPVYLRLEEQRLKQRKV